MSTFKHILIIMAVFAGIGVLYYGIWAYKSNKDAVNELTRQELEYRHFKDSTNAVNDSIKSAITGLKKDINNIGKEKERIKQVYSDKTKKDISKPAIEQGQILKELINK